MCSFITDEIRLKAIDRLSFDDSTRILEAIVKSSYGCYLFDKINLCKYLPSYDDSSKLDKLGKILPSAAKTIRMYLKHYLEFTMADHHNMHKKKINKYDLFRAFGSEQHIEVATAKIANLNMDENLPWLIESQQFTVAEYVFMHTLNLVHIQEENNMLVGIHDSGLKIRGLHFEGLVHNLPRLIKSNLGFVHFSTIIAITCKKDLIKEFKIIQANDRYNDVLQRLKDKELDFTNKGSVNSIYNWTLKRFEK